MTEARHTRILVGAALASFGMVAACKGCGEPKSTALAERPSLAEVTVKPIAPSHFQGMEIKLDQEQIAAKVKKTLEGAGIFAAPEAKRPAAKVSFEVEMVSADESAEAEIGAKVRLRVAVRPTLEPPRFSEDVAAMGQATLLSKGDADQARAAFQHLAERTVEDLLHAYVARQKLWDGGMREIVAALNSTDNDLCVEALRIVAVRNLRGEIPTVLSLLSNDDENVRDASLGALVALRERSAVKALAESRPMRDAREMRKILDAIATLGGREAQEYLSFVAETHDDEEIRTMARAAMVRLSRHLESNQTTK
jgi:hypothetical protein